MLSSSARCRRIKNPNTDLPDPNISIFSAPGILGRVFKANLASAAEQLVTARFAFGGTFPYAPDLVLISEFIKKDSLEHVLRHSLRLLAGPSGIENGSTNAREQKRSSRVAETLQGLTNSKSWKLNITTQRDNSTIVELSNLLSLPARPQQPVFNVSAITSLEHAISLVEEDLGPQESLLVAHHFGTPSTGKYLSQFVNADASSTNNIPFRLPLGPAAPSCQPIDAEKRYTSQHFTRISPVYIAATLSKVAIGLLGKAAQGIKEKKRTESTAIEYFERGIFIDLGVFGMLILTCIDAPLFFGARAGLRKWAFI